MSGLFTLPFELQVSTYEDVVSSADPIGISILKHPEKLGPQQQQRWRVVLSVRNAQTSRPPILAVCKYLRSFVAPIYLSCNTIVSRGCIGFCSNVQARDVLRQRWGDYEQRLRHICIQSWVGILHKASKYWVRIITDMRLMAGTLVITRRHEGASGFPAGEICQCGLQSVVAASSHKDNNGRRLMEVAKVCATEDQARAHAKTCPQCRCLCLTKMSYACDKWGRR